MQKIIDTVLGFINVFLSIFRLVILRKRKYDVLEKEHGLLAELCEIHSEIPVSTEKPNTCLCVIFSMDRAMQLHSLLSSYYEKTKNPAEVVVLYRVTDDAHGKAYDEVFKSFQGRISSGELAFVLQDNKETFRRQLISILGDSMHEKVFFLVDDIIFIEDYDLKDFASYDSYRFIPSLRMGANLEYCYTKRSVQAKPSFIAYNVADNGRLYWIWKNGELDWAYPLSVDGHIFSRREIIACCRYMDFNSPNTFEGNLQDFNRFFNKRTGVCYKKSILVNIPINKVQNENDNRYGSVHQDDLLKKWNEGYRIDYRKLYGFLNMDVHQEIEVEFIKRKEYDA